MGKIFSFEEKKFIKENSVQNVLLDI